MSCYLSGNTWFETGAERTLTEGSGVGIVIVPILQVNRARLTKVKGHLQGPLVK